MLNAAIYGLGRWGSRLVESVQGSSKIKIAKGISREPARHKELSEKTGIKVGDPLKVYRNGNHIGSVEVIQVRKDISAADIKQKSTAFKPGDTVK